MHLHLAAIRKILGVHSSLEILNALYNNENLSFDNLVLTPRGTKVFELILKGHTIEEIALELGMSYSGVRRHKEKMILANNCSTMKELVSRYYEQLQEDK